MRYKKEEQLAIGRQVYNNEITHNEAVQKYDVSDSSIDKYVHAYKKSVGLPVKETTHKHPPRQKIPKQCGDLDIDAYMAMSKEELINELIIAKANELRAKKGYEVKGVGANKEFISLNNKNTK